MPRDAEPDEPADDREGALIVPLAPANDGSGKRQPGVLRPSKPKPRGSKSPRAKREAGAVPPPPPPIPADLAAAGIVVPPRPPLPSGPIPDQTVSGETVPDDTIPDQTVQGDMVPDDTIPDAAPAVDTEAVVYAPVEPEEVHDPPAAGAAEVEEVEVVDDFPAVELAEGPEVVAAPEVAEAVEADAAPHEPVEAEASITPVEVAEDVDDSIAEATTAVAVLEPDAEPETAAAVDDAPEVLSAPVTVGDALVIRGVTKSFGDTRAVEGIDLTVPAGTFYGLVGPNGAGKTTTLSMIAGLLTPDKGSITVAGVDATSKPLVAKRMMGVLPDRLRTFDRLTGRQLLYYYGVLRGLSPSIVESRTADLARAFDLTDALGRVVSDYSAGMAKKVMLAGALIHSPRLLVLDEPFESVDPVSSAIILDILSTYVAHGGTVILSSHGMELVERVCSRVAVIVAGQVLAEGTIDEVRGELTLEQRFIELAGGLSDVEGLEWLHTFSD